MKLKNNVRNWASEMDSKTLMQAERTAKLPVLAGPLALMPDAHLGIGATIGSVIPTENAIIPSAVGVDIGCGMIAVETSLRASELPDSLGPFMAEVRKNIPAGMGKGHDGEMPKEAEEWLASHPHELGQKQASAARRQLGSLGSGNHFFEVCLDEADSVWLLLHSGSRGVGNQLAQGHIRTAREMGRALEMEDPDLMHFTQGTAEFERYVSDMLWAQDYAMANREIMMTRIGRAFFAWVGHGAVSRTINCHHNFAQQEIHDGRKLWVTRKGAIQAREGMFGIIPGSMGTESYVVTGLGNPLSYESCSHGAGRRMSRRQAKRDFSADDLRTAMAGKIWNDRDAKALLDEIPGSYKEIGKVMADQEDLVRVEAKLTQILNYKGS